MIKILHTADWQLGLKLRYFDDPEAAARARAGRYDTVRRIGALAQAEGVDVVLVAGDVFDDNTLGDADLQQALDALATFPEIPIFLLPGNHDCGSPDGVLSRLAKRAPAHVRVCLEKEPIPLMDDRIHLYPCPLMRRHEHDDPTAHLPERQPGDPIRIALAHGGCIDFSQGVSETPNLIDVPRILKKGFDYVALGDWHSPLEVDPRAWYAGAHEGTRFKERDPGQVLVVALDGPGSLPQVTQRQVGQTQWRKERRRLDRREDVTALAEWLQGLPERSRTLVRLELEGSLDLDARSALTLLLERERVSLLHLRVRDADLATRPSDSDIEQLSVEGFVGQAVKSLLAENTEANRDALVLLHRFVSEVQS